MSDLLYSEIESDLRSGVRELMAARCRWPDVLAWSEGGGDLASGLWSALAAQDLAGLPVPEELGGSGVGWRETAVVLEELGRAVAPVPFFGSAVLATAALLAAGDKELLPELADGSRLASLAVPLSTLAFVPAVRAEGGRLTGAITSVADALTADVLLVPIDGGLYVVEAEDTRRTAVTTLDLTRPLCDIVLDSVPGRLIAENDGPVTRALTVGAALLASEQLGVAEQCLETTLEYVRTRHQFGRPIGSYQGLKHRLADLWVSITQARAVARHAADCVSTDDPGTAVAVAVAQAHCSGVVVRAAEECVQMHGGIGFTWEHPAHLYLKRAKSSSLALGGAHAHRAVLAGLVDLPA